MHAVNRIYWSSTLLLAILMFVDGIQDMRNAPLLVEAMHRLGYPPYLLPMLGVAKVVAAPILPVQRWPHLKEWVYAGFAFDLGGAILSHLFVGDGFLDTFAAVVPTLLLAVSYVTYRLRDRVPLSEAKAPVPRES